MFSRVAPLAARTASRYAVKPAVVTSSRHFSGLVSDVAMTAEDARKVSGYNEIDFAIDEDAPVLDAVQKFAAYNIGCLVTTDAAGK